MDLKIDTSKVDTSELELAIQRFAANSKRGLPDIILQQSRLLCEDLARRTPPNTWNGKDGKEAGEKAITGDLFGGREVNMGGFMVKTQGFFIVGNYDTAAKDQDGRRREGGVLEGFITSLFTNKEGVVYGVEKHLYRPNASVQEMLAHRDRYRSKSTGKMSKAGLRTRDVGRHVFIDRMVVRKSAATRFLKVLHKRVGFMAGGWASVARRLGRISRDFPAWIRRHSSPGDASLEQMGDGAAVVMVNRSVYPSLVGQITSRVQTAVDSRVYNLTAQIRRFMEESARQSGL